MLSDTAPSDQRFDSLSSSGLHLSRFLAAARGEFCRRVKSCHVLAYSERMVEERHTDDGGGRGRDDLLTFTLDPSVQVH